MALSKDTKVARLDLYKSRWAMADRALAGEDLEALAKEYGVSVQTVRNSRSWGARFPKAHRPKDLSPAVAEILASLPEPDRFELAKSGIGVAEARKVRAERKTGPKVEEQEYIAALTAKKTTRKPAARKTTTRRTTVKKGASK